MSKQSNIHIQVHLDDKRRPQRILWQADENANPMARQDSPGMFLAFWDKNKKNAPQINLWTKDMLMHEIKYFAAEALSGMSQSLLSATGDKKIADMLQATSQKIIEHTQTEDKVSMPKQP